MSDSSDKRKNPRRDGSGWEREEVTETAETVILTVPVWVKPNFSKRIMGRASLVIFRVLTSAREGEGRRAAAMRRRRRGTRGDFVILGVRG